MPTDRVITFKVTDSFYNRMVEAMEAEGHNSMSDFVKFAVRYYMMNCGNADNARRGGDSGCDSGGDDFVRAHMIRYWPGFLGRIEAQSRVW